MAAAATRAGPGPVGEVVATPSQSTAPNHTPSGSEHRFDKHVHSTRDPSSVWVIVNKTHPIDPADFRPDIALVRGYQVARPATRPVARLLDAADAAGVHVKIASAFR